MSSPGKCHLLETLLLPFLGSILFCDECFSIIILNFLGIKSIIAIFTDCFCHWYSNYLIGSGARCCHLKRISEERSLKRPIKRRRIQSRRILACIVSPLRPSVFLMPC